jgi:hypothetical protein
MKGFLATLGLALFLGAEANAVPFTWQISGTADSGNWNANSLAGLDYTLRLSIDAATPDGNHFDDFGQWFNLAAEIEIESLGTRTLGDFTFIEQFRIANADRLWIRGPGGGAQSDMYLPLGTMGDPDFLTPFGPVLTLGDGSSDLNVVDVTPGFELHDIDGPNARITVSAGTVTVPEAGSTVTLLVLGLMAICALRKWLPFTL